MAKQFLTKKKMICKLQDEGFIKTRFKEAPDAVYLVNPKLPYAFKFEGGLVTMVNVTKEQRSE